MTTFISVISEHSDGIPEMQKYAHLIWPPIIYNLPPISNQIEQKHIQTYNTESITINTSGKKERKVLPRLLSDK